MHIILYSREVYSIFYARVCGEYNCCIYALTIRNLKNLQLVEKHFNFDE